MNSFPEVTDFFRRNYASMVGYCTRVSGLNPEDIEEEVADVINSSAYQKAWTAVEIRQITDKPERFVSQWLNRRAILNVRSRYKNMHRYDRTFSSDDLEDYTADLLSMDNPADVLAVKRVVDNVDPFLIDYETYSTERLTKDVVATKGARHERKVELARINDRSKFCRARKKFLALVAQ